MRVVLQRVQSARVEVDQQIVGQINQGLMLLVGITTTDTESELEWMAKKCLDLRIFADENGRMDRSVVEIQGEILVVSQFTLYGDCRKGRRPAFDRAARGDQAEPLYNKFLDYLNRSGCRVESGIFGAMMQVFMQNDGPVTLILERE
jgi:D-tyrosyl-tRNA(Tyr) deacylase